MSFAKLRSILAELYPDEASARRVVADIDLAARQVVFSGHAVNNWHAILTEAEKADKVAALFTIVLGEYGTNVALRTACDDYRHNIELESESRDENKSLQPNNAQKLTDLESAAKLYIESPGIGKDTYIIKGTNLSKYTMKDKLVVYGEIIPDIEIAIALLQIIAINPDSLLAQAILVHPERKILGRLRVDNQLQHLTTSELIPAVDYAVGYLFREGRVRLRPHSGVAGDTSLVVLEPEIVDGTIIDHLETPTLMRVTSVGQGGAVVAVELLAESDKVGRNWPPVGTILKLHRLGSSPNPIAAWFTTVGTILLFVTLFFLMLIFTQGDKSEGGREFMLILMTAFSAGAAIFFLGGWAKAEGTISMPGLPNNPLLFGITIGVAGFVIVLIVASLLFRVVVPAPPASLPPTPEATKLSVIGSMPVTLSTTVPTKVITSTPQEIGYAGTVTPLPCPTARLGKYLIEIADFYAQGNTEFDAVVQINDALDEILLQSALQDSVQIERCIQVIARLSQAREAGQAVEASLVIWGRVSGTSLEVNFEVIDQDQKSHVAPTIQRFYSSPETLDSYRFLSETAPLFRKVVAQLAAFTLGEYFYNHKRYPDAIDMLGRVIQIAPELSVKGLDGAYLLFGNAKQSNGDAAGAVESYRRAIELNPSLIQAYYNRAATNFTFFFKLKEAQADLETLLKLNDAYANGYILRGVISNTLAMGQSKQPEIQQLLWSQTITDFTTALDLLPSDEAKRAFDVYNNRGSVFGRLGDFTAAEADFSHTLGSNLDCDPIFAEQSFATVPEVAHDLCAQAAANLAEIYIKAPSGNYNAAARLAQLAVDNASNKTVQAGAYLTKGKAHAKLFQNEQACAAVEEALSLLPPNYPNIEQLIQGICNKS